jgi:hypothetical protein
MNLFEKKLTLREGQNYLKLEYDYGVLPFVIHTFTHILVFNLCIPNMGSVAVP